MESNIQKWWDSKKAPRISPSQIARASICPHSWYLDCHGPQEEAAEPDAGLQLLMERGEEYEASIVKKIRGLKTPKYPKGNYSAGALATVNLMRTGAPWIYQGVLRDGNILGFPDLLRLQNGRSNLGGFSYEPIDIKNHKEVSKKDQMQLLAYSILLEPILGRRPARGGIWLNTGKIARVDIEVEFSDFAELMNRLGLIAAGEEETYGYRCGECKICPWHDYCRDTWKEDKHLSLLYGMSAGTAQKFEAVKIRTYRDLAKADVRELSCETKIKEQTIEKFQRFAHAYNKKAPIIIKPAEFPKDIPILFYDIETYESTVYLHGVIKLDNGRRESQFFVARDPKDEKKVWQDFLKYVGQADKAVIYTWSRYEFGFVEELWKKYGGDSKAHRALTNGLVDMCAFVKSHFALPVSSYSIKQVAPVFGFQWRADDAGGLNSETWYRDWLDTGDEKTLRKIVDYNDDDVRAMEVVYQSLIKLA